MGYVSRPQKRWERRREGFFPWMRETANQTNLSEAGHSLTAVSVHVVLDTNVIISRHLTPHGRVARIVDSPASTSAWSTIPASGQCTA